LYIKMADSVIREISERNRIPVIVGGTGLYLKSLIKGMADIPEIPIDVRKKIKDMIETDGIQRCYEHLKKKDPEYAARISPSDRQRIERALEVITFTNEKFSSFHSQHRFGKLRYNVISIGIMPDRKLLYERINKRTRDIFSKGIIQETEFLIDNGYGNSPAFNAIGYYESCRYIKREITLDEAIETTALRTRQYAKRQITWFRRTEGQIFTDPDNINIIFRHIDLCLK
ncbi:MAG: tRNA (adenosine(37)-N6)-dimethylallyltransferase MiaA, partial [Deltaproteobacteria bacterium]|nr:tRNA (adenosine(37)-N6)-dimethylallyltransferase MiaA [Deltaproteobacteria bacterium]